MPRRWIKRLAGWVAALMIWSVMPMEVLALASSQSAAAGGEPSGLQELPERAGAYARHYQRSDGTKVMEVSAEPLQAQSGNGQWRPADKNLRASNRTGFAWENGHGPYKAAFAPETGGPLVRMEAQDHWVQWTLLGAGSARGEANANSIKYRQVQRGVDLQYQTTGTGIKEELVITEDGAPHRYRMQVETDLTISARRDGGLDLADDQGQVIMQVPQPYAVDAAGEIAPARLAPLGNGLVELQLDERWFRHPDRVLPIVIDPSLVVVKPDGVAGLDTWISKGAPAINFGGDSVLRVGRNGTQEYRSLLKFSLSGLPAGARITNATLTLNRIAGEANNGDHTFGLHELTTEWMELDATWQKATQRHAWTQAGGDYLAAPIGGPVQISTSAAPAANVPITWNVTEQTARAARGLPNLGFLLTAAAADTGNSEIHFASSDGADSALAPRLTVTYTEDRTPPAVTLSTAPALSGATAALAATVTDLDAGVERVEFWVDGGAVGTATAEDPAVPGLYKVLLDTTAYPDGHHMVEARAYDRAGNMAQEGTRVLLSGLSGAAMTGGTLTEEKASLIRGETAVPLGTPVSSPVMTFAPHPVDHLKDSNNATYWKSSGKDSSGGIESLEIDFGSSYNIYTVSLTPLRPEDNLAARVELLDAQGNPVSTADRPWILLNDGSGQQKAFNILASGGSARRARVSFTGLTHDPATGLYHANVAELKVQRIYYYTEYMVEKFKASNSESGPIGCTASRSSTGTCSATTTLIIDEPPGPWNFESRTWESCTTCNYQEYVTPAPPVTATVTVNFNPNDFSHWETEITDPSAVVGSHTCSYNCQYEYWKRWSWPSYVTGTTGHSFSRSDGWLSSSDGPNYTDYGGFWPPGYSVNFSLQKQWIQYDYDYTAEVTVNFTLTIKNPVDDYSTPTVTWTPLTTGSYTGSSAPGNAVDGDRATHWAGLPASSTGQRSDVAWLELPFAAASQVNGVYLDPLSDGMSATLILSLAGSEVRRVAVPQLRKGLVSFDTVSADRLRIELTNLQGSAAPYFAALSEVRPVLVDAAAAGTLTSAAVPVSGEQFLVLAVQDSQPAGTVIGYELLFDSAIALPAEPGRSIAVPDGAATVAVRAKFTGDGRSTPALYDWTLSAPGGGRLVSFANGTAAPAPEAAAVSFTAPQPDAAVSGAVGVTVSISSGAADTVKFYVDGVLRYTDTDAVAWSWSWQTDGDYSGVRILQAVAYKNGVPVGGAVTSVSLPAGSPSQFRAMTTAGMAGVTLTWQPISDASYRVYRATSEQMADQTLLAEVTQPTYTDATLAAGQRGFYRIVPVSAGVAGRPSRVLSAVAGQPAGDRLGLERFYPYTTMASPGLSRYVNLTNGNLVAQATDLLSPGPGLMAAVRRTFNGLDSAGGWRWNHEVTVAYDAARHEAVLTNSDGAIYRFAEVEGQFRRPAGVYIELTRTAAGFTATHKNGITWIFDGAGRLGQALDRNGNAIAYIYDGAGKLDRVVDSAGREIDYVWQNNRLAEIAYGLDEGRLSVAYEYDAATGYLTRVRDLAGHWWSYRYDLDGRLVGLVTPQGALWTVAYDSAGRALQMADPLAGSSRLTYAAGTTTVQPPLGNPITFIYNATGQLLERSQQVTHYDAPAIPVTLRETFRYDADFNPVEGTDPDGTRWQATYDPARGNPLTTTDPMGSVTRFTYGDTRNPDSPTLIERPGGIMERFSYDAFGNQVEWSRTAVGESEVAVRRYGYYANGLLASERDMQGGITHYEYDQDGNLIRRADPLGNTARYQYDWFGRPTGETDPGGVASSFLYDPLGRMLLKTFPDASTTAFRYTPDGQLHWETDNAGRRTTYTYDLAGRLTAAARPTGTQRHGYDAAGNVTRSVDSNGLVTTFAFDEAGRTTSVTTPQSGNTRFKLSGTGKPVTARNANGHIVEFRYDALGNEIYRATAVGTAAKSEYRTEYDLHGRKSAEVDPLWNRLSYVYDPFDRLIDVRSNLLTGIQHAVETTASATVQQAFTAIGSAAFAAEQTDAYNGITRLKVTPNATGAGVKAKVPVTISPGQRITGSVAAQGSGTLTIRLRDEVTGKTSQAVTMALSGQWKVSQATELTMAATDPYTDRVWLEITSGTAGAVFYLDGLEVNQHTRTSYDAFPTGNAVLPARYGVTQTDALGRSSRAEFDLLGRVVAESDALGHRRTHSYDDAARTEVRTDAMGRPSYLTYDIRSRLSQIRYADGQTVSYQYDANGNRVSMTDGTGTTSYAYDQAGRLSSVTDPRGRTVSYQYAGTALTRVNSPVGSTTFSYGARGLVTEMTMADTAGWSQKSTFGYDAMGNLTSQTSGSHITTWTYDEAERLKTVLTKYGTAKRYEATYTYDAASNRTAVSQYNSKDGSTVTHNYTYDPLNRLIRATESGGAFRTYVYDSVGNRISGTAGINSTTSKQETFTYDRVNRLTAQSTTENSKTETTSYEYDANGNQTRVTGSKGVTGYTYDSADRLTEVSLADGARLSYRYNGDGDRVYSQDGEAEVWFLFDRGQVIADLDGAGAVVAAYYRNDADQLVATQQRAGTYFYHLDGLGSVVGLTKADGTWDTIYKYDEYGIVQAQKGAAWNQFQYTGAPYSQSAGLYSLGSRYYQPTIGRFITQDTWKGNPWEPWTQHLYAYVGNDPVNYIDPTGHRRIPFYSKFGMLAHVIIEWDLATKATAAGWGYAAEKNLNVLLRPDIVLYQDPSKSPGSVAEVYEIKPVSWNNMAGRAAAGAQRDLYVNNLRSKGFMAKGGTTFTPMKSLVLLQIGNIYTGFTTISLNTYTRYGSKGEEGIIYYSFDYENTLGLHHLFLITLLLLLLDQIKKMFTRNMPVPITLSLEDAEELVRNVRLSEEDRILLYDV